MSPSKLLLFQDFMRTQITASTTTAPPAPLMSRTLDDTTDAPVLSSTPRSSPIPVSKHSVSFILELDEFSEQ